VIGTIFFVMIIIFFFTNVYLWHDAAVKQMDNMYLQKINSPITISLMNGNTELNITDKGGDDAVLTMLWIDSGTGPTQTHQSYLFGDIVPAGSSLAITLPVQPTDKTVYTLITTVGNSASCTYSP